MQSPILTTRLSAAYARADKCRDRRTSDELQRIVLDLGASLIHRLPHHNVLEPVLDDASLVYATGEPHQRLAAVAKAAGLFIEFDTVGYARLTHVERHNCRALVAKHDAAEGRGSRLVDLFAS